MENNNSKPTYFLRISIIDPETGKKSYNLMPVEKKSSTKKKSSSIKEKIDYTNKSIPKTSGKWLGIGKKILAINRENKEKFETQLNSLFVANSIAKPTANQYRKAFRTLFIKNSNTIPEVKQDSVIQPSKEILKKIRLDNIPYNPTIDYTNSKPDNYYKKHFKRHLALKHGYKLSILFENEKAKMKTKTMDTIHIFGTEEDVLKKANLLIESKRKIAGFDGVHIKNAPTNPTEYNIYLRNTHSNAA